MSLCVWYFFWEWFPKRRRSTLKFFFIKSLVRFEITFSAPPPSNFGIINKIFFFLKKLLHNEWYFFKTSFILNFNKIFFFESILILFQVLGLFFFIFINLSNLSLRSKIFSFLKRKFLFKTIFEESPTLELIVGIPLTMDSATTLGKDSPWLDSTWISIEEKKLSTETLASFIIIFLFFFISE